MRRAALPLALAALVLATACARKDAPAAPAGGAPAAPAAQASAAGARLVDPEPVRHAPKILASGTLKARQASPLSVAASGILARVAVARGAEVKQGTLLAALDADLASAQVAQAEAGLAAAKAQLAMAEDGLARLTRIKAEDGASESQAVQVRAQRDLAAAQVQAAAAQLRQAQVNLDHHFLRAPFAGVVTRVPDGTGVTVGAGVPLVTLLATRTLVLETSLTQEEAAEVKAGARAVVHVPATGARTEQARVTAVVPAVEAGTNRVPVEIEVPNDDGAFLPNAHARAELGKGAERDAWRVPAAALVQRDGGFAVWVAAGDGKARAIAVRLLAEEGDAAVVSAPGGWPKGAKVVARPPVGIAEGTVVAEAAP